MFSFITGKVFGVFIKIFALHVLHFDKCNGVVFVLKFKTWNFCLKYVEYINIYGGHIALKKLIAY